MSEPPGGTAPEAAPERPPAPPAPEAAPRPPAPEAAPDQAPAPEAAPDRPSARGRRRSHKARWAAVAVAVPVALLVAVLATRQPAGTRAADSPLLGKAAPALNGSTVDGEPFQSLSSEFAGKWVLVNFFATWCVPCRQEHSELIGFHRDHQAAGDAEVVGVVYEDSLDAVRDFRRKEGGLWPMLVDPDGRIALDYGVSGVPESYLISPEGVVAAKVVGGVQAAALDGLLAQVSGVAR